MYYTYVLISKKDGNFYIGYTKGADVAGDNAISNRRRGDSAKNPAAKHVRPIGDGKYVQHRLCPMEKRDHTA